MKKLLKQLVIDTATKYIFLALIIDGQEVQTVYEKGSNDHSVTIMPHIKSMLDKEEITLKEIDQVIAGVGPGSYTGVRIGVTIAKMIGYLNNIEVFKVSSLALMASHSDNPCVLAFVDARRGNGFMGLYFNVENSLVGERDDVHANVEEYMKSIPCDFEVVTEGKPKVMKLINTKAVEKVEDIHTLVPNYLRQTEAERSKE